MSDKTDYRAIVKKHGCLKGHGCNVAKICMCGLVEDAADEVDTLRADLAAARAEVEALRGLLWYGWHEMHAIRARSGVPLDHYGTKQGICEDYWSDVVDAMADALGEDAKPWPSDAARAALNHAPAPVNPPGEKPE